jgi:hypothetical protein
VLDAGMPTSIDPRDLEYARRRRARRQRVRRHVVPAIAVAAAVATTVAVTAASQPGPLQAPAGSLLRSVDSGASDPNCHPSYRGACVPRNVADVDCAGGGGNGPSFARGTFEVVGRDVYGLDADRDGVACE